MFDFYLFSALKVLHLGCLIFWLGPTLGSWWVLINIKKINNPDSHKVIYKIFLQSLWLEHIAFIGLLASGISMAMLTHALGQPWLTTKIIIITAVIIPLEIIDIYIGNFLLPKRLSNNSDGKSKIEVFYHGFFTKLTIVVLPPSVLTIFILAVTKMAF